METSRRSSRAARASQPLQSASQHSSNSSNSSGRADRATRSHHKPESPRKTTPSGSLSSEPLDDAIAVEETMQTRRKRSRADEREKSSKAQPAPVEPTNDADEGVEDEEAVRCICGLDEYPGPPQLDEDNKDGILKGIEDTIISPADVTEDLAGFFLQCDVCKVWQHGGCVGIMSEDTSPEEYFCEDCRKDLHKIYTAPNGQRYSHYLPLYQSLSRTTSRAASSKDGTRSPRGSKSGRPSSSLQSAKRRSTMNSRDAAYDEEEQLRRAIEASKGGEKSGESTDGGTTTRRGKRGRSDSEEKPDGPKRQRTASASPSPTREPLQFTSQADSDEGANGKPAGTKKIRGAAARNHKEKELREERERLRQEAAKKRMGRAERRRVEGENDNSASMDKAELPLAESEPPEETPVPIAKTTVIKPPEVAAQPLDPPSSSQVATPDTPPPAPTLVSHKKGGRPPNARKGKVGKNQYTKDRDVQDQDDNSPKRSQSRDVPRNGDDSGHPPSNKTSISEGKASKSKGAISKVTMADMKKRVTAILGYISRTQVELASESLSPTAGAAAAKMIRGIADGLPMIKVNGEGSESAKTNGEVTPRRDFKDLACVEMMDVLTRQLVKWQKEFT